MLLGEREVLVWFMKMHDGKVIDGTAFYDSISFNDLWEPSATGLAVRVISVSPA